MKFLCDQMLGTLAKWLRVLGFDTFYANNTTTDDGLLQIAKSEKRTIISRDKELITRGKKKNMTTIEITSTDLDEQLNQVLKLIHIDEQYVLSRCTLCNTILKAREKSQVEGKVPEKVFENNDSFWFCKKCDKYYWKGSHYEKIIHKIEEIKKKTIQQ
jgi:uncharacterized protein with PIN domain